jgi:hypothetical protein
MPRRARTRSPTGCLPRTVRWLSSRGCNGRRPSRRRPCRQSQSLTSDVTRSHQETSPRGSLGSRGSACCSPLGLRGARQGTRRPNRLRSTGPPGCSRPSRGGAWSPTRRRRRDSRPGVWPEATGAIGTPCRSRRSDPGSRSVRCRARVGRLYDACLFHHSTAGRGTTSSRPGLSFLSGSTPLH